MGYGKINSEILKLAREIRGVTQEELANSIGIEQGTLSKIEKGILPADEEIIKAFSKSLDFPSTFFTRIKSISGRGSLQAKIFDSG
ncbi:helix-turn-helix transcriptional regulator [Paraflavitalea speifideaquila]|uniref:helix-turn-helix domain-containing protein n=1 Tax=Paraflavitalea speifideaquila TaxID=3076558 RepID=UPI00331304D7